MTRFLVIRLSSIGDIVHALPAVAALGESFPQAEVHWAVEPRYAGLLAGNPYVHRLIEIDTLGWRGSLASAATLEDIARTVLDVRRADYTAAIDFQGLLKSAMIAWLSRSRERLGLAERWLKEPLAGAFYTERAPVRFGAHAIEENMALVEMLARLLLPAGSSPPGWLEGLRDSSLWKFPLPRTPEDDSCVEQRLGALGVREFIVISPGGGWNAKRWAPENYSSLIRCLDAELPCHFLLTGSPDEEPAIRLILERAESSRAAYFPATLVELIALVRRASLFLGGDTGPLHLAAALRTAIVAIYGPTDPARNGPWNKDDFVLSNSGPIDHTRRGRVPGFLRGVPVESVLDAVRRRLASRIQRQYG
jgi:heptosyltransferase-1